MPQEIIKKSLVIRSKIDLDEEGEEYDLQKDKMVLIPVYNHGIWSKVTIIEVSAKNEETIEQLKLAIAMKVQDL